MTITKAEGLGRQKKQLKEIVSPALPDFRVCKSEIVGPAIHYYYKIKSGNSWAIVDSCRAQQVLKMLSSQPEEYQMMARIVFGNDKIVIANKNLDEGDIAALPVQIVGQTYAPTAVRDAIIISLSLAIMQGHPLKHVMTGDPSIDAKIIWSVKACRENKSSAFSICDRILDPEQTATEFIEWLYPDIKSYEAALHFVDGKIPDYMLYGDADRRAAA